MALSNHERVGKALDLLKAGLGPFVEREMQNAFGKEAQDRAVKMTGEDRLLVDQPISAWDTAALLKLMWEAWHLVFKKILGPAERSLLSELRDYRNRWAHQHAFNSDDADRALDSMARLLTAVSAPQADDIFKMKMELRRLIYDEQVRYEKRKSVNPVIESQAAGILKPWREVITPHRDVASGRYQQAEFAADLWQVHLGEGSDEYRDPVEFFRRTYLTESLKRMLSGAVQRLAGKGGEPVVQLQTNFGGGKTHSMLALYHLFSGINPTSLSGIDTILQDAETDILPKVRRIVLVGNKISPGNPVQKPDGTQICTLWGELAWQLGGKKAFEKIAADDEKATSPGDVLRSLFTEYGPCLILIDEWVAYARQLHDQGDLPAGSFETQFSFAQVLTESARAAKNCLLVISLPASDTGASPHAQADDVEVGGQRGREALDRLRNVVGRMESSWRPASAEEGFEIVRRRIFEPLTDPAHFRDRDVTAREFADLYRTQSAEFPPDCREADYENRIKAAYPIHPEVFDRLYADWSTLVKFQRTRGVLRLMAVVIHSLWERGDRNPLIMPANIPIDDSRVQFELTRYLSDNWIPIIEKDVDGPSALPPRLDGDLPTLGKFAACRRVARTIYLGSAPNPTAANRGIEDRRIKLGCVMPGESPAIFGDALRRLSGAATYLYQDGPRYWYSTQPTVTKLAEDRAEQFKRNPDAVIDEIEKRVRTDLRHHGDFRRIHPMPQSGQDVPDELDARLVVLGVQTPHTKDPDSPALNAAKKIFEMRGNAPRLYRNTLVFLAADKTRLQDLDEATRRYLAWKSILDEKVALDLSPHQVRQAEAQRESAESTVISRIPETYQWLLVPVQPKPESALNWEAFKLAGQNPLAEKVSRKLKRDELLISSFAGTRLRMELDRVPLWRGNHVEIRQLIEDFARYPYLPRLANPSVLIEAIRDGLALFSWVQDAFGYADSFDEAASRYRGLRGGQNIVISDADARGLLVKADIASQQIEVERKIVLPGDTEPGTEDSDKIPSDRGEEKPGEITVETPKPLPKRFHGSVVLDTARVGRDAGRIAEEVVSHLSGIVGAVVTVTLDIDAEIPSGVPENVVRIVTENSRTLKFTTHGFEKE